jgi:hypothetical protein
MPGKLSVAFRWQHIATDEETGFEFYGRGLQRRYTLQELVTSTDLLWFREAVADVRSSMSLELPSGQLAITELQVYRELALGGRTQGGALRRFLGSFLPKYVRTRRGMVRYSENPCVYLTPEGIRCPRVVYEEVAHSLLRLVPVDSAEVRSKMAERYVRQLLVERPTTREVHLPILCHLDIFRGFLRSDAYTKSGPDDRRFAERVLAELDGGNLCRAYGTSSRRICRC